jgi:23S rRNA (adenine2503-C2)-methyltransferase
MGMGEPLENYDNVVKFLKLVSDENGLNIGMRHISLSTSGIVPRIYDLLDLDLQLTLSVSLHAPNNEIRSKIMPVNNKWDIDELLKACKIYADKTSRRISFEYAMIKGVNDTPECAKELSKRLKGFLCHVNLIPANEVPEKGHERSDDSNINEFKTILEKNGLAVTIRRTLGSDINASCGQLRREKILEKR